MSQCCHPIGLGGGISTYNYVRARPSNEIDPSGLDHIIVGDPATQAVLQSNWDALGKTAHGAQWEAAIDNDHSVVWTIGDFQANNAFTDYDHHVISVDPNFHPRIRTTKGIESSCTLVIFGHEVAHAATKVRDTPETGDQMDNVNQNENPLRKELGLPDRTEYAPYPWWVPDNYPGPNPNAVH